MKNLRWGATWQYEGVSGPVFPAAPEGEDPTGPARVLLGCGPRVPGLHRGAVDAALAAWAAEVGNRARNDSPKSARER